MFSFLIYFLEKIFQKKRNMSKSLKRKEPPETQEELSLSELLATFYSAQFISNEKAHMAWRLGNGILERL